MFSTVKRTLSPSHEQAGPPETSRADTPVETSTIAHCWSCSVSQVLSPFSQIPSEFNSSHWKQDSAEKIKTGARGPFIRQELIMQLWSMNRKQPSLTPVGRPMIMDPVKGWLEMQKCHILEMDKAEWRRRKLLPESITHDLTHPSHPFFFVLSRTFFAPFLTKI